MVAYKLEKLTQEGSSEPGDSEDSDAYFDPDAYVVDDEGHEDEEEEEEVYEESFEEESRMVTKGREGATGCSHFTIVKGKNTVAFPRKKTEQWQCVSLKEVRNYKMIPLIRQILVLS